MRVDVAGRGVDLTPTEFQLLVALVRRPGRILTRSKLLDAVHGVAFESYERAIDTHVKNLRRKLGPTHGTAYVLTVRRRVPLHRRSRCLTTTAAAPRAASPTAVVAGR
jgi:DNA-binding response OmpR family regulator